MPVERPDAAAPAGTAGTRRPRAWLSAALLLAIALHLYGLYSPGDPVAAEWFPNSDKVLHFVGFAAPSTLAVLLLRHWWPIAAFAGNAVLSEIVQLLWLPHRSGDVLDLLADLAGLLPALATWWWPRRRGSQRRASATADGSPTSRTPAAARRPNA